MVKEFVSNRNASQDLNHEQVVSAYGHTHAQQCDGSTTNGNGELCYAILTGGGGGCCGEYTRRGFYVMQFDDDRIMRQPLSIDDAQLTCQYPCGAVMEEGLEEKILWDTCCHTVDDPQCVDFDAARCHEEL